MTIGLTKNVVDSSHSGSVRFINKRFTKKMVKQKNFITLIQRHLKKGFGI